MAKNAHALSVQVSQQLLRRIIQKEFPAGTVLPSEREIGATYTVSRPVAREAIKLLEARGIVSVHPRQGATVGQNLIGAAGEALLLAFHQADAVREDILHMRMLLEPQVAALAAQHGTPTQQRKLSAIRQRIVTLLAAVDEGEKEQADALWPHTDQPLHVLLGEMCHNPVFRIFVEIITNILWINIPGGGPVIGLEDSRRASQQHLAICEAVLAGDAAAAGAAMEAHLDYTRDYILRQHNQLDEPIRVIID